MIYNAGRSQVLGRKERKIKEIWLMMTILQSFQQVLKVLEMKLYYLLIPKNLVKDAQLLHNFLFLIFRYRDRYRDRYAKKLKLKFRVRVRFRNRNANWSGSGIGTFRSRIRHSCTRNPSLNLTFCIPNCSYPYT